MAILDINNPPPGEIGNIPNWVSINTNDTVSTILGTTGYLNNSVSSGALTPGPVAFPGSQISTTMALVNTQTGPLWCNILMAGKGPANVAPFNYSLQAQTVNGAPSLFTDTVNIAAPGIVRALTGNMIGTATTMVSGNLVGVRGALNVVGASGGYLYGTQGKVIATGTLSGTSWTIGTFGQLDVSQANINGGSVAPIWGDWGQTSGTLTSLVNTYGIAMTNSTAAVLNAQIYLFGGATNLLQLNTNSGGVGTTYVQTATTGALSGTVKKLAISIDSVTYYIPVATAVA
jgi:hypothetical protein